MQKVKNALRKGGNFVIGIVSLILLLPFAIWAGCIYPLLPKATKREMNNIIRGKKL